MKLRIKGNSIRLRVMRSELERLQSGQRLEESVQFAPTIDGVLRYSLAMDASTSVPISVSFRSREITTLISRQQLDGWSLEAQVGLYATLPITTDTSLEVAIEKDFACLDSNDAENADTFVNPLMGATC
jgi:hypothetical protein